MRTHQSHRCACLAVLAFAAVAVVVSPPSDVAPVALNDATAAATVDDDSFTIESSASGTPVRLPAATRAHVVEALSLYNEAGLWEADRVSPARRRELLARMAELLAAIAPAGLPPVALTVGNGHSVDGNVSGALHWFAATEAAAARAGDDVTAGIAAMNIGLAASKSSAPERALGPLARAAATLGAARRADKAAFWLGNTVCEWADVLARIGRPREAAALLDAWMPAIRGTPRASLLRGNLAWTGGEPAAALRVWAAGAAAAAAAGDGAWADRLRLGAAAAAAVSGFPASVGGAGGVTSDEIVRDGYERGFRVVAAAVLAAGNASAGGGGSGEGIPASALSAGDGAPPTLAAAAGAGAVERAIVAAVTSLPWGTLAGTAAKRGATWDRWDDGEDATTAAEAVCAYLALRAAAEARGATGGRSALPPLSPSAHRVLASCGADDLSTYSLPYEHIGAGGGTAPFGAAQLAVAAGAHTKTIWPAAVEAAADVAAADAAAAAAWLRWHARRAAAAGTALRRGGATSPLPPHTHTLRVGLLSYDLRAHASAWLAEGYVRYFNPAAVSLSAWMYGPLDNASVLVPVVQTGAAAPWARYRFDPQEAVGTLARAGTSADGFTPFDVRTAEAAYAAAATACGPLQLQPASCGASDDAALPTTSLECRVQPPFAAAAGVLDTASSGGSDGGRSRCVPGGIATPALLVAQRAVNATMSERLAAAAHGGLFVLAADGAGVPDVDACRAMLWDRASGMVGAPSGAPTRRLHVIDEHMGHTFGARASLLSCAGDGSAAAAAPAAAPLPPPPVVVSFMYPGTTAAPRTGFIVADTVIAAPEEYHAPLVLPEGAARMLRALAAPQQSPPPRVLGQSYSERLLLMPHAYTAHFYSCASPLMGGGGRGDGRAAAPAAAMGSGGPPARARPRPPIVQACAAARHGAPAVSPPAPVRFGSLNAPAKLDPLMFGVWVNALRRAPPGSVLVLLNASAAVLRRVRSEAAARGLHPSRLTIAPPLPHDAHVARYAAVADVLLDPRLVTGHTTTADALWAGVPTVTAEAVSGAMLAGRVTSSFLQASGMGVHAPTLTHSLLAYEDAAARLAAAPRAVGALRRRLARASLACPMLHWAASVAHLQRAYRGAWETAYLRWGADAEAAGSSGRAGGGGPPAVSAARPSAATRVGHAHAGLRHALPPWRHGGYHVVVDPDVRAAALAACDADGGGGGGASLTAAGGRYRELTRRRVAFEAEAAGGLQALGLSPGCGYRLSLADV